MLGRIHFDGTKSNNVRTAMLVPLESAGKVARNKMVRIVNPDGGVKEFLAKVVDGPYFHAETDGDSRSSILNQQSSVPKYHALVGLDVQGEMHNGRLRVTNTRPAPGAEVHELTVEEVSQLAGIDGDMLLGALGGYEGVTVHLQSDSKSVLPRNLGIFGTVGSGKSNTSQVVIEEAARAGWAVIALDVEGEYIEMDAPAEDELLFAKMNELGRPPAGLGDFGVYCPVSCTSERADAQSFTLRTSDYDWQILAEIMECAIPERNAMMEVVDYLRSRAKQRVGTTESEELSGLLDAAAGAKVPYNIGHLLERCNERIPQGNDFVDFRGLSAKLTRLKRSEAFDNVALPAIDPAKMMLPGRVSVFDISVANDTIKNLVTADLLRKVFAYKIAKEDSPRTLVVIEEAHTFISRERAATMGATLTMIRDIARRGRKRWLGMSFVSQQPGHLPPEVFELCNTRIVHNVKSTHNLEALMKTAGDVTQEMWQQCPLLGSGQAVVSTPQFKDPVIVNIRPASTKRKFTQ